MARDPFANYDAWKTTDPYEDDGEDAAYESWGEDNGAWKLTCCEEAADGERYDSEVELIGEVCLFCGKTITASSLEWEPKSLEEFRDSCQNDEGPDEYDDRYDAKYDAWVDRGCP